MTKDKSAATTICMIACVICILMLSANGKVSEACKVSMAIAANNVIPILLPYTLLSNLIAHNLPTSKRHTSLLIALLASLLCGNPIGAIMTESLQDSRLISKKEASALLPALSCTSPAFCICVIGGELLLNKSIGILIWSLSCIPGIITTIIILLRKSDNIIINSENTGISFSKAIMLSAKALAAVCISMVFFSAVIAVISNFTANDNMICITSALLEIGNGVINAVRLTPPQAQYVACFAAVFCGLSVYLQILVSAPNVQSKTYIPLKLAYSLLTTAIFIVISAIFGI